MFRLSLLFLHTILLQRNQEHQTPHIPSLPSLDSVSILLRSLSFPLVCVSAPFEIKPWTEHPLLPSNSSQCLTSYKQEYLPALTALLESQCENPISAVTIHISSIVPITACITKGNTVYVQHSSIRSLSSLGWSSSSASVLWHWELRCVCGHLFGRLPFLYSVPCFLTIESWLCTFWHYHRKDVEFSAPLAVGP